MRPRGLILGHGSDRFRQDVPRLAGLIDHLNKNVDHHIITIEDPIEFLPRSHHVDDQPARDCTSTYRASAEAIRRALRQDPDVILVGEMRDLETIEAAITAAGERATSCSATLHTNSAQGTINRIIDAFPGNLQDQIRTQLST